MGPGNKGARRSKPWRSRPWDLELGGLDHRGLDRHYATCRDRVALWALGIQKASLFLDGRGKRLERNRPPQNGGTGGAVALWGEKWGGPDDQPEVWAKSPPEWAGPEVVVSRGEIEEALLTSLKRLGQTASGSPGQMSPWHREEILRRLSWPGSSIGPKCRQLVWATLTLNFLCKSQALVRSLVFSLSHVLVPGAVLKTVVE